MSIQDFNDQIINGHAGFKAMEDLEYALFPDRERAIADFVIRCLANPRCEGSQDVVDAIIEQRELASGGQ